MSAKVVPLSLEIEKYNTVYRTFDVLSLTSSLGYFLTLVIFLVLVAQNDSSLPENTQKFNIALLVLLILPLLYFSKLGYNSTTSADRYQKAVLIIYFLIVFIDTAMAIANYDREATFHTKNFVLPVLIVFTGYLVFRDLFRKEGIWILIFLNACLTVLYCLLYVDSIYKITETTGEVTRANLYTEIVVCSLLFVIFAYLIWITARK